MKRKLSIALRLVISIVLLVLLFREHNFFTEIAPRLGALLENWPWVLAGLFSAFLGLMACATRWYVILRGYAPHMPWRVMARTELIAAFFNVSSIGVIGGDAYKIMSVTRRLPGQAPQVGVSLMLDHVTGFVAVGMSNTMMEFDVFLEQGDEIPQLNPAVVLVNGAEMHKASQFVADPNDDYWTTLDERVAAAGLSDAQVQIVWLKEARASNNLPFPLDALVLKNDLRDIIENLSARFPNLKIVYLSSRTYGGYATTDLSPEPHAYQSAFAVKWLIEDQIEGKVGLNFDPNQGTVYMPWLSWGPYLWADGVAGDPNGIIWEQSDFSYDGTHPSPSGRAKVAGQLHHFLRTDVTAVPWFLSSEAVQ